MLPHYYEVTVAPSNYTESFSDFILEETQEAIEERDQTIIIRTEENPDSLMSKIEQFALILSARMDEQVTVSIQSEKKQNEDWLKNYQDSVQPILIGDFYIHPSWHESITGKQNIIIDPALAFGSGHHETTSMCVDILSRYAKQGDTLLDVGCGSGILALAAAKMGAVVDLCDTDELAIDESRKNFDLNGLSIHHAWVGSSSKANRKYAIVSANIVTDVLEIIAKDLMRCLDEGALLVLSGILENKKEKILKKYDQLKLIEELHKNEWVSLVMKKC